MSSPDSEALADAIRRSVLDASYAAGVGHIGSSLSIADLVAAVFAGRLEGEGQDRDRFLLSKGHAALALYAAMAHTGRLDPALLQTYCADGSLLGVHPEVGLAGIECATGSLGQGVSVAVGHALAAQRQGSDRRTYVLLSDAELNEGNVWEAVQFAGQHRLDGLTALIDLNGQQALDFTADVIAFSDVRALLEAHGWEAVDVPGHDHAALGAALDAPRTGRPRALVAHTTFGYGVSFMESTIAWHYLPLSSEQHASAIAELEARA